MVNASLRGDQLSDSNPGLPRGNPNVFNLASDRILYGVLYGARPNPLWIPNFYGARVRCQIRVRDPYLKELIALCYREAAPYNWAGVMISSPDAKAFGIKNMKEDYSMLVTLEQTRLKNPDCKELHKDMVDMFPPSIRIFGKSCFRTPFRPSSAIRSPAHIF